MKNCRTTDYFIHLCGLVTTLHAVFFYVAVTVKTTLLLESSAVAQVQDMAATYECVLLMSTYRLLLRGMLAGCCFPLLSQELVLHERSYPSLQAVSTLVRNELRIRSLILEYSLFIERVFFSFGVPS